MTKAAYGITCTLEWLIAVFAVLGTGAVISEVLESNYFPIEDLWDSEPAFWATTILLPICIFPWSVNLLSGAFSWKGTLSGDQR